MDPTVMSLISYVMNTLLGFVMYFMKVSHDTTKEQLAELRSEVKDVRDKSFKREDFHDFRDQLWTRLDRMETDFKQQLLEFKK